MFWSVEVWFASAEVDDLDPFSAQSGHFDSDHESGRRFDQLETFCKVHIAPEMRRGTACRAPTCKRITGRGFSYVFFENFSFKRFTTCGGTRPSTLPSKLAISFTKRAAV